MNHFNVSLIKSGVRICAGVALVTLNLILAGALLIVAEILGIIEEFVDKRKED